MRPEGRGRMECAAPQTKYLSPKEIVTPGCRLRGTLLLGTLAREPRIEGIRSSRRVGEKTLARDVIHFQADAVRVFEEHRVVARCPWSIFRRVDDGGADTDKEGVQSI